MIPARPRETILIERSHTGTGNELLGQLNQQRKDSLWRKENDFVDIELMDAFYDTAKAGDQFDSIELLDMEQLWEIVKKLCADRVTRSVQDDHEIITWQRLDKGGAKRNFSCSFAPEFLIQIFDVETRGNYIE